MNEEDIRNLRKVGKEEKKRNSWSWKNGMEVGIIVKRKIEGKDREVEWEEGIENELDRIEEMENDLRILGIEEVKIIGRGKRIREGRSDVEKELGKGMIEELKRIGLEIERSKVGREGERIGLMELEKD